MDEGGSKAKAGQLVRHLNIPAKREYGTWHDLHGFKDGATLSDAVVAAVETHYGHAGRAFLQKLTRDKRNWQAHYDAFKEFIVGGADGQVKRAASKFGLLVMAGELATEYRNHPVETHLPGKFL